MSDLDLLQSMDEMADVRNNATNIDYRAIWTDGRRVRRRRLFRRAMGVVLSVSIVVSVIGVTTSSVWPGSGHRGADLSGVAAQPSPDDLTLPGQNVQLTGLAAAALEKADHGASCAVPEVSSSDAEAICQLSDGRAASITAWRPPNPMDEQAIYADLKANPADGGTFWATSIQGRPYVASVADGEHSLSGRAALVCRSGIALRLSIAPATIQSTLPLMGLAERLISVCPL